MFYVLVKSSKTHIRLYCTMKSFSVLSALLLICMLALAQVWAAPVESEAVESEAVKPSEVSVANSNEQACNDWFNAAYSQSARPLV